MLKSANIKCRIQGNRIKAKYRRDINTIETKNGARAYLFDLCIDFYRNQNIDAETFDYAALLIVEKFNELDEAKQTRRRQDNERDD